MDFIEDIGKYEQSMENAYLIITKKKTLEEIYDNLDIDIDIDFYLPFNPVEGDGRDIATIELLLEYFEETEEYEKCSELVKIKECLERQID